MYYELERKVISKMNKKNKFLSIIVVVVVIIGAFVMKAYNQLITLDNKVEAEWSQVENVMQRRADLIPNLVSSIQGSMTQEKEVLKEITEARKAYAGAKSSSEKGQANEQIEKGLGNFVTVLNEDYPKLASSENVKTLMTQLEGSENRISVERRNYIQAVETYNQQISKFPDKIIAKLLGFEKKTNYVATEQGKEVPQVEFK